MDQIKIENFNIEKICNSGQCFRMKQNERGAFDVVAFERYVEIKQEDDTIALSCSREEYDEIWKSYLGLEDDYDQVSTLVGDNDPYMKRAMEYGYGIRILKQDLWEMIVSFLISQQNNIPRIRKCIQTICEKYGERKINLYGEEYFTFPTPISLANTSEEELRACNLGYRAKYIHRTAKAVAEGSFDLEEIKQLDYESAKKELLTLYGVGIKVAECICLYGLHHLDAFPVDTHIKNVLDQNYQNGFPFEHYQGVAGIVQQYAFYYDLLQMV